MRNLGKLAFGITVGVLAPAALLTIDAGKTQREKLTAPGEETFDVDGTKVTAHVDRAMVDRGDSVHVTLTADKRVEVGLVVFGSSGNEGQRVPAPPVGVAHKSVTVEAGKPTRVALRLSGARNSYDMATYTIYATSAKAGNRLATLQSKAGPNIPTGEIPDQDSDTTKLYGAIYAMNNDESELAADATKADKLNAKLFSKGKVARLSVYGRPVNQNVAIAMPETSAVDKPFDVKVTIRNPGKEEMAFKLSLEAPLLDRNIEQVTTDKTIAIESPSDVLHLAKGEKKTFTIPVTAHTAQTIGLLARIECTGDGGYDCYTVFRTPAFDAIEITREGTPAVATK